MARLLKHNARSSHDLLGQVTNPFLTIQNEVDKALHGFYDLFEPKPFDFQKLEKSTIAPSMDLIEEGRCFKVEVEMPGMDEKNIRVSLNENILTIKGEKTTSKRNDQKSYISREICYGQYTRNISLPLSADADKATASFSKGLLCVTIPKRTECLGHEREIKISKTEDKS